MTLSLNPTLTQNKEKNTEIQVTNTDLVTQHKPMPQLEVANTDLNTQDNNTESNINTAQSFDINNKAYQDFIKAKLAAQKGAEVLNDKISNNDYMQGAYRAVKEGAKSFNPFSEETKERYNKGNSGDALWEAWNTITGQSALKGYNKEKLKEKEAQNAVYSYLEKYGTSKESIGLKNYEEEKLKEQKLIKGIQNKEIKDLSEEEKDYLRDSESNISRFIDYLFTDENKNLQKYKNNLTRQNINHELVKKLVMLDSQNSSIFNLTEDLQKEAREKTLTSGTKLAQMYGYDRLEYDKEAQDYVLIDKEGNKLYPDMQSVFNNLGTALEANYYDVVSSFIPVGKAAQVTKGGIKLTQSLAKTALQSAGMSALATPLDYINMQNETAQEGNIQDILKHSAGNALGSAVGVYVGAGVAKGVSKAYNSIKDLKNLSTDDLKNIKLSRYLDNEEASIHRKLAKFNKSEIDSNYEIFKNLQSDRIISKEMRDPTFMGNFMDKISDYNVLKHLSSKKESQDKLLSALFSNKELAREFAGKLTSEEATIVNKAIHAMGENFTRLSKEYEQQIINEYAKSGKIKGLNPYTEYFEKGSYKNSKAYKDVVESQKANHFQAPYGYEPHADANTPQIKADNHIIPQNLPEVYKHMLDEIDKQAKQDYKTSIDNLANALHDTDFKATLLQGYKQVTDDAIDSLGLDNQLTNTLIRETQKLESKPNISLSEAIELRKNINEIMRNYNKSSSDLKKFRANKHLDNIKDSIDNAIKAALDSKVAQNEAHLGRNVETKANLAKNLHTLRQELEAELTPKINIPIENKHDGRIAIITKKGIEKIESDKAIQKSIANGFSEQEHLTIAKRLDELYQNSVFKETHNDKNGVENIQIHRYTSKVDDNTEALITLKETKEGKYQGNRIYSMELDSVMRLNSADQTTAHTTGTRGLDSGTNGLFIEQPPTFLSPNPTQNTLTSQEANELFSHFQQANKNYAQIKESLNDKFAKALTKGMNKKDLDSRLTIEQWKQRVLDTQWGDSIKGLENTIFKNFNPRMQKHTQMLTILRALDRNVKLNDDTFPIDFTKILSDIENLEKLTLHPEIYPILDTFKTYAKSYQFAQEISKAKALENQVGGGALATTLEGRIKVFLTNRLFKKLFAFLPYIGDNAAITKALQSAIKDLKYPSEITLETLKVLNKADLDKGFKPIKDKENKPRFEYKANTPLNDAELQDQIKGNKQILTPKDTSEIESLASNPLIQNMERQAKYNEELTHKINQFEANKENIQQDILNNLVVATQEIKQNTELLKQLATQLTQNNPIHTPNKSIIKAEANNDTYFIINDKNNITAIEKQEIQNLAQPKTYDELMQRDKAEATKLDSMRNQYVEIAEIKEKEAQKQLLLEYKPEVARVEAKSQQEIGTNLTDLTFTDKKGKEHTLTKETQEAWLNTFNLKSLDESYIPKHSDEIRQALGGKEIKLQLGSLKKLVAQGREQYIPQIKEVLDSPEAIMRDDIGEYLFIKHLKDDDYFVNVSFDNGEYLISISNGIKETRNLNNKLEKGGSFIYQSPNFNSISQKLLQTSQYSANKIDNHIIPQNSTKALDNFKKEFNIHDEALKPTGYVKDNANLGTKEILDSTNEYRILYNQNTYKQDGYALVADYDNNLELLDLKGFSLGKLHQKQAKDKDSIPLTIDDLDKIESISKDSFLLNGNKTLEQAKKLAQSEAKKGVYIDYFNEMQDPIKSINKATTKDGVEVYILQTQKFKQKEPLTNLMADVKQLSQRTSQETKEIILNHILENDRLLYLLKQGINTQHLSPFQKEVLESVLDIANNPAKLKEYKLQGLQKQLDNLNSNEAYHIEKGREYDKSRYAKDKEELEREIAALKEIDSHFTYTTQETKGIRDLRNDLKEALMPYKSQHITNKETGMQGIITADEINKISSRKAVDKSIANGFSRDEHFVVAQDLKTLFENSRLKESHADNKQREHIKVHRFIQDLIINDKQAQAKITLFEKIEGKNRIYTLELESLNKPDSLSVSVHNTESAAKAQSVATAHPETTTIAKTDADIIPQKTLKGDSITNPDISYVIQHENISKDLAEKIANNAEIDTIIKRGDFNKAEVSYYDKNNMTMYFANIGNYIDDEFGMMGDKFFLNNVSKNEFYIPPTKSLQDFKEQSLNQIEHLKKAIKTEIDNAKDEKELHKTIKEIKLKARENAEKRFYDLSSKEAREFYTTKYDEAMQEMSNYYDKKFTNILNNEIDSIQIESKTPQEIIKEAKQSGKSVKETKELLQKNKEIESANMLESKVKAQGQDLKLIYNTQEAKHIATLRTDLKEALSPYLNKEIINKATGITAQISTTGLNKIASKKAVDKSIANGFSRDEHFKVAQDLKTLFENATKKESYADKKQSSDVMAMHRFFAEIIINDKQAQAKMTLKESIEHGNRIYSLELEELIPSINAQPHTKEAQARGS